MPTTPNLGLTHIETAQSQKEVTANEAFDGLDLAMNDSVDIACGAGGTIAVAWDNFRQNERLRLTGAPVAAFTLRVPGTRRRFLVHNATGRAATVETGASGGAQGVIVGPGEKASLYGDGTDLVLAGTSQIAVAFFIAGLPVDGELSGQVVVTEPFMLPSGGIGSLAKARQGTGSWESDAVFSLRRNGTSFGSVTFPAASVTGLIAVSSATEFVAGDLIAVVNPVLGSPATELRDISITLRGAA